MGISINGNIIRDGDNVAIQGSRVSGIAANGLVVHTSKMQYDPIFGNNTWEQINSASIRGEIPSTWLIGDTKNITLSTNEVLTSQIYDKYHDPLTDGGYAGLTIGMKNLMVATRRMHSVATNYGGLLTKELIIWLNGELISQMPSDLQAALKLVNKKTSAGNGSATINTDSMKVFTFSQIELSGSAGSYSAPGEGTLYPIFTNDESRIKYLSNGNGAVSSWWQRSPYYTTGTQAARQTSYLITTNTGSLGSNNSGAANPSGICFGFCI